MTAELPILAFESATAFERWLAEQIGLSNGLWLRIAKKGSGVASVNYDEALEVALCYGWIDGQKKSFDEQHWLQKFTPRRARSVWSQVNRAKAEALIASGRMQPVGLAEVERAKADGRWEAAYASQRTMEVPADLARALTANPVAQAFFDTLNSANRYAILWRVQTAKRPETRAARIAKAVAMCAAGEKYHP